VVAGRGEHDQALLASGADAARQVDRALTVPVGDEPRHLERLHARK
jgi:hypothetical protein